MDSPSISRPLKVERAISRKGGIEEFPLTVSQSVNVTRRDCYLKLKLHRLITYYVSYIIAEQQNAIILLRKDNLFLLKISNNYNKNL